MSKPFTVRSLPLGLFVQMLYFFSQGKEVIARVHLQMQLGKRRIELEVRQCGFTLATFTEVLE